MANTNAQQVMVDDNYYDSNGNWSVSMSVLYGDESGQSEATKVEVTIVATDRNHHTDQHVDSCDIDPQQTVPPGGGTIPIEPLGTYWIPDGVSGSSRVTITAILTKSNGTPIPGSGSDPFRVTITF